MSKPSASPLWMELSIDRIEDAIRVSARSSRGEQTTPRTLDPAHDAPAWLRFAAAVERAAARCNQLSRRAPARRPRGLRGREDCRLCLRPGDPGAGRRRRGRGEADYYLRLREIWSTLPVDLTNATLRALSRQPSLILGLSVLTGHHRMVLHTLHPRGLPRESLAVIEEEDAAHKLWASGAGLPGKDGGVGVLETTSEALLPALFSIGDGMNERGWR